MPTEWAKSSNPVSHIYLRGVAVTSLFFLFLYETLKKRNQKLKDETKSSYLFLFFALIYPEIRGANRIFGAEK